MKWGVLTGEAAAFLVAASGICVRHPQDVPLPWFAVTGIAVFLWLFFLARARVFSGTHRFSYLVGTTVALNLLAQATGGSQSPLTFSVFLLMGVAAWDGEARFGFFVAVLFSLLEAFSIRKEELLLGWPLYFRWAAFIVSAFFLTKVVKIRNEKENLHQRFDDLKQEAGRLAASAEPLSFGIPKDKLLMEEGRLTARVGSVLELEEALERLLALFRKAMGAHTVVFFLSTVVGGKKALRLRAASTDSTFLASDVTVLPGETLPGLSAKEGRRILLNRIPPEGAGVLPYYRKPEAVLSFLAQPVYLRDQGPEGGGEAELAGVLAADSLKPDFFTPAALELVDRFVQIVSETIHGMRVLHFSKTKTRNLHALYEISNSFSSLLNFDEILETALRTAMDIFVCESAYVALGDEEGKSFPIKAWKAASKDAGKPADLEMELGKWVRENKKPIRYSRGQKDKSLGVLVKKEGMLGSTQSFLMAPLLAGDQVLGVIRLNSGQVEAYQAFDQDILTTIANQTAMALENALMVEQIHDLAIRDGLTGAYNHRYFQEKLDTEIVRASRQNKDLSLLLLDVDHFKKFNDTYGHQEGDRVLRTVSEIIQSTLRDKVDTVCRYGGEEFAVILPECDANAGRESADRILKGIGNHFFGTGGKSVYRVTASIGLAAYPFDGDNPEKLTKAADEALYMAKNAGRNCVRQQKPLIV